MAVNLSLPRRIQTFVILDLEATGLPTQPADYPVRIVELSMVTVQRPETLRRHDQASAGVELAHLPPAQRGLATPKRPIKHVEGAGLSRGRQRPRLADVSTPPASDGGSDDASDEAETPLPVPSPPRVRNSLLVPFSPRKPISAVVTDITGLDNELLEPHSAFDRHAAEMLRAFLGRLAVPVCLVAHNGQRYDFPLLKAELLHAGATWLDSGDLLCADSLDFFRAAAAGRDRGDSSGAADTSAADDASDAAVYALDSTTLSCGHKKEDDCCIVCNPGMWQSFDECHSDTDFEFTRVGGRRAIRCRHGDDRRCVVCENVSRYRRPPPRARRQLFSNGGRRAPSMKLPDVYERRFGVPPERSHSAADDVETLLLLCLSYGERFYDWANRNHSQLGAVKPMWSREAPPPAARTHRTLPAW